MKKSIASMAIVTLLGVSGCGSTTEKPTNSMSPTISMSPTKSPTRMTAESEIAPFRKYELAKYPKIKPGDRSAAVKVAQQLMKIKSANKSYLTGPIDGYYGPKTQADFVKMVNETFYEGNEVDVSTLPIDASAWRVLLGRLSTKDDQALLVKGAAGKAVYLLQLCLRASGQKVNTTGTFDDQTVSAIKGFQKKISNNKPSGKIDEDTWSWLFRGGPGAKK